MVRPVPAEPGLVEVSGRVASHRLDWLTRRNVVVTPGLQRVGDVAYTRSVLQSQTLGCRAQAGGSVAGEHCRDGARDAGHQGREIVADADALDEEHLRSYRGPLGVLPEQHQALEHRGAQTHIGVVQRLGVGTGRPADHGGQVVIVANPAAGGDRDQQVGGLEAPLPIGVVDAEPLQLCDRLGQGIVADDGL